MDFDKRHDGGVEVFRDLRGDFDLEMDLDLLGDEVERLRDLALEIERLRDRDMDLELLRDLGLPGDEDQDRLDRPLPLRKGEMLRDHDLDLLLRLMGDGDILLLLNDGRYL